MASTRGPWPKVSIAWAMLLMSTGVAAVPLDEQPTTAKGRSVCCRAPSPPSATVTVASPMKVMVWCLLNRARPGRARWAG